MMRGVKKKVSFRNIGGEKRCLSVTETRRGGRKMELTSAHGSFSSNGEEKKSVESFQRVFDTPPVHNVTPNKLKRRDRRFRSAQYEPPLPNWILWLRFKLFGDFGRCILSRSVMYVSFVRAWTHSHAHKHTRRLHGCLCVCQVRLPEGCLTY